MGLSDPTSPDEARIRAEIAAKKQLCPPHGDSLPVVSIESFFTGNTDIGSIAVNVYPYPGLDAIFTLLSAVRARPDVADVLVEIYDEEPEQSWPYAERVYVFTSATADEVAGWFLPISADSAEQYDWADVAHIPGMPALPEGMSVVSVWWD